MNMRPSILSTALALLSLACCDIEAPGEPPSCWQSQDSSWCTADLGDQLIPVECEGGVAVDVTDVWPLGCAAGQPVDFSGWDGIECTATGCFGTLGEMRVSVLPQCAVDALGGEPANVWPATYCSGGEQLPWQWDEWSCSGVCLARLGSLWTTPMPACASLNWDSCRVP